MESKAEDKRVPQEMQRGLLTDIALLAGPPLGAATGWALNHYGQESQSSPKDEPPQVNLPPGTQHDE
jgi:hypothetical protein